MHRSCRTLNLSSLDTGLPEGTVQEADLLRHLNGQVPSAHPAPQCPRPRHPQSASHYTSTPQRETGFYIVSYSRSRDVGAASPELMETEESVERDDLEDFEHCTIHFPASVATPAPLLLTHSVAASTATRRRTGSSTKTPTPRTRAGLKRTHDDSDDDLVLSSVSYSSADLRSDRDQLDLSMESQSGLCSGSCFPFWRRRDTVRHHEHSNGMSTRYGSIGQAKVPRPAGLRSTFRGILLAILFCFRIRRGTASEQQRRV